MKITYERQITCRCPVDNSTDVYDMRIESDDIIRVEAINALVVQIRDEPTLQEDLTQRFANELDAVVTTIGHHSGVKTTVTAEKQ